MHNCRHCNVSVLVWTTIKINDYSLVKLTKLTWTVNIDNGLIEHLHHTYLSLVSHTLFLFLKVEVFSQMFVELWSKSMLLRRSTFTSLTVTHFEKFSQHEQDATCARSWLRLDRWHTFRFACKARAHNTNKMWFANYLLLPWNNNVHPFHLCCCVAARNI